MAKRRKGRARTSKRRNTPLARHKRVGKQVLSPLGSVPNLRLMPWLRDQFPDFLWVCFHLSLDVDRGLRVLTSTLDLVNETLDDRFQNSPLARPTFDGSLRSWETIPEEARSHVLNALQEHEAYDVAFPEEFAHVLGMYPDAPGGWVIDPWMTRDLHIDPEQAENALSPVILASAHGQEPVATRAKAMALRGLIVAQRIHVPRETGFDLLPKWPNNVTEEEWRIVEPTIRSAFGAFAGAMEYAERVEWARSFWRANWRLYPCRVSSGAESPEPRIEDMLEYADRLSERVDALWRRFEQAAMQADPDLFDPDRHEVLTGIVARSLRVLATAVQSPSAWTAEHSPPLMRAMVEGLIVLSWLVKSNDREMFSAFKDYGRGHLKLVKLHWEQYVDSLDEVPDELRTTIDDLDRLVNDDMWEEFQNIDLSGSFAKIDTRKMAEEAGLLHEYRLIFAPSSSEAHGEWGHLDRYALTRCLTPSHRFHRVPSGDVVPTLQPKIMDSMLSIGQRIVDTYCASIGDVPPDTPIEDEEHASDRLQ